MDVALYSLAYLAVSTLFAFLLAKLFSDHDGD